MNEKTETETLDAEFEAVNQAIVNLWRKLEAHGRHEMARAIALMTQDLDRVYEAYKGPL
jgi:hypothetical protein